jgi:hypothetical protein
MHGTLTFVLIPSQQIKPPPAKETVVSDFFDVHYLLFHYYYVLTCIRHVTVNIS